MTETSTDLAATLRRAAEQASQVLPPEIGAFVAQKITFALDSPMRVADLHPFYRRLAAEVLALAEQQQALDAIRVRVNEEHMALEAFRPGGEHVVVRQVLVRAGGQPTLREILAMMSGETLARAFANTNVEGPDV